MSKLRRDAILYMLGAMLIKSMGILLIPLYTAYFTVEEYGLLAILMVFVALFSNVFLFGVNSAVLRYYFAEDANADSRRAMYGTAFVFFLIAPPLVALAIVPGFAWLAENVYGVSFFPLFAFVLLIGALKPIEKLCTGLLRCQKRAYAFIAFSIALFLTQFAAIYLLVAHYRLGLQGQVLGQLIATCVFVLVAIAILIPHVKFGFDRGEARKLLSFGIPLLPFFVFNWLLLASPRILLERLGSMSELGLFALASQFSGIVMLLGTASDNALVPHYYETANEENASESLGRLATKFLALAGLAALAVHVFADDLIILAADSKFHPAKIYVPLLLVAAYLRLAFRVFHWNLMSNEKTKTVSILNGINFGILVAGIYLLTGWGQLGVWGVIWAMVISESVTLALGWYVAQSVSHVSYDVARLAAVTLVIASAATIANLVRTEPGSVSAISIGLLVLSVATFFSLRFVGIQIHSAKFGLST